MASLTCPKCDTTFEYSQADSSAAPVRCPSCGSISTEVTFVFDPDKEPHAAPLSTEQREALSRTKDPLLGRTVGGCRIADVLGAGAVGVVYKAHHLALDIPVAVKTLQDRFLGGDQIHIDRFVREARSAAKLQHQNIVGVLNVGEEAGTHFIVMQFVDGDTLDQRIRHNGKLPVAEALGVVAQVCDGLELARKHKIVHRDIKPSNIIVDRDGTAKVMDLGLARAAEGDLEVTQAGTALGTPAFMSPEQARDATTCDHRSDLYSLGCTLYWAICGAPPFNGRTAMEVLYKHVHDPVPDPRSVDPVLPPSVADMIMRLLAKKPVERYQTARELATDIREVLAALGGKPVDADEGPPDLEGVRILVADDLRPIRFFFKSTLKKAKADVTEAENGLEALHALTTAVEDDEPFDLLISDVHMPKMDGLELLRRVRSDPDLRDIPVIIITMEEDESVVLQFARLGISSYLVKPPKAKQVLQTAKRALGTGERSRIGRGAPQLGGLSASQASELYTLVSETMEDEVNCTECPLESVFESSTYVKIIDFFQKHCPDILDEE